MNTDETIKQNEAYEKFITILTRMIVKYGPETNDTTDSVNAA